MPAINNVFSTQLIVDSFRLKEFRRKSKRKGLCDFLPNIDRHKRQDLLILESWQSFFTAKNCPWVLTSRNSSFALWKINETVTLNEIEKIRQDPSQRWFKEGTNIGYKGKRFLDD